jgi:hypothetical protein
MAKSTISDNRKKRRVGRPAVGAILIGVRVPPAGVAELDAWIKKNAPGLSRPGAIRRLVEMALAGAISRSPRYSEQTAAKARELAARAIDGLIDPAAPAVEKAVRKRRLLKGPSVFRDVRVDQKK